MTSVEPVTQILNEVSKLEIIIGTIIGIVTTFIGYSIVEYRKDTKFSRNVKRLVRIELRIFYDFLSELLSKGIRQNGTLYIDFNHELEIKIKRIMPDGKFNTVNYTKLNTDEKGAVFDDETLTILEETYRNLQYVRWNEQRIITGSAFTFHRRDIEDLIKELEVAKKILYRNRWLAKGNPSNFPPEI